MVVNNEYYAIAGVAPTYNRLSCTKTYLLWFGLAWRPFIYYVITCRGEGGQKMPIFDYFQY